MTSPTRTAHRIAALFAIPVACLLVAAIAGCEGAGQRSAISYSAPTDPNDEFERGASRPPTADTMYRLGKLMAAQGKDDQAYAVLTKTIERYPDCVPAYCELSALQIRQRKVAAGITTLEKALKIAPNDPVVLNDLGMAWMLRGEHQKGLDYFTQAAAKSDDARYKANMALATGMMGRYDEAYALYEQIMRPARAHYNLAVVAEARHDPAKADEEYAKAKALDSVIQRKSMSSQ